MFIEAKNTPFCYSHPDRREVELICRHFPEKISMRDVTRVTGHHQTTIVRYYRLAGEQANSPTSAFPQDPRPRPTSRTT